MKKIKKIYSIQNGKKILKKKIISEINKFQKAEKRSIYDSKNQLKLLIQKKYHYWGKPIYSQTFNKKGHLLSRVEFGYDALKNLIKKRFLNGQGHIVASLEWSYKNKRLIKYQKLKGEHHCIEQKEFFYNSNTELITEHYKNFENAQRWYKEFFYDENGKLVKIEIKKDFNSIIATQIIHYDPKTNLTSFVLWFDALGKLQRKESFKYHFNLQLQLHEINDFFSKQYFKRHFNNQGKITKAFHIIENGTKVVEHYFYNKLGEKDRQEKWFITERQQQLIELILFEYDEKI